MCKLWNKIFISLLSKVLSILPVLIIAFLPPAAFAQNGNEEKKELECRFDHRYESYSKRAGENWNFFSKFEHDLAVAKNYRTAKRGHSCVRHYNTAKKINNAIFVDLRDEKDYEALYIPESIRIDEYKLKTKSFLKNKPVVLVDYPYRYLEKVHLCESLIDQGFSAVYVLEDGISGFGKTKFFKNIASASSTVLTKDSALAPAVFDAVQRKDRWLIFHLTNEKSVSSFERIHQVEKLNSTQVKQSLVQFAAKNGFIPNILIVADDSNIKEFEVPASFGLNSYYLEGGLPAYDAYLSKNQKILNYKELTAAQENNGCG